MRELLVCPSEKRNKAGAVHRLRFSASGGELVAWVEGKPSGGYGRMAGVIRGLYAYDLASDAARSLLSDDWFHYWADLDYPYPRLSADLRYAAAPIDLDRGEIDGLVTLTDLLQPDEEAPVLAIPPYGVGDVLFSSDGAELIAVRNLVDDYQLVPDVARFRMNSLAKPPRARQARKLKWEPVIALPPDEHPCSAALSTDDRWLAVGTEATAVYVVDLKRKKLVASLPWEGRKLRYTAVTALAFDPAAEWVVLLASRRLFAQPIRARSGASKAWHTKTTLGDVIDFAFHPSGRFLCAAFADGQARYLDPLTGKVRQAFKWAKKPKPLYSVTFAPDGLTCAAGGANGRVILWDVDV
jgi:WD40 repeat protein